MMVPLLMRGAQTLYSLARGAQAWVAANPLTTAAGVATLNDTTDGQVVKDATKLTKDIGNGPIGNALKEVGSDTVRIFSRIPGDIQDALGIGATNGTSSLDRVGRISECFKNAVTDDVDATRTPANTVAPAPLLKPAYQP